MLKLLSTRRFFVVIFSLLAASFVLFISLWRINLAAAGKENHETSIAISAGDRVRQLFTPPILPDHPLYLFGMVTDRVELSLAPSEKQFGIRIQYANTRLATANALIERGRLNLAMSTITKAEKYLVASAGDIQKLPSEQQEDARVILRDTITLHKDQLIAMKSSFSDGGRAIIDGIIEQILILHPGR